MKIAIFTDVFVPKVDGVVTSLEQLVLEFDRQGHQVLVVAPRTRGGPKNMGENVQVFYVPSVPGIVYPDFRMGLLSLQLTKAIKEFSPEIIQIPTVANVGWMGVFVARMLNIPAVGVFHGYFMKPEYLQVIGIKRGARFIESIGWKYLRMMFGTCEAIVSPSGTVKQDLIDHGFTNPVIVCPNGIRINTEKFRARSFSSLRKKYAIDPDKTVLYVGRVSKEKNLEGLLSVFRIVAQSNRDAKLFIVGDGPFRPELEELSRSYHLEKQVIFTGEMKHDELFRLGIYKLAKVFVTCSTSEVQPMSMIEALFYGLPIVASISQGMDELVRDGWNGYLVSANKPQEYADKINLILNNKQTADSFSTNSLERAKNFTVQHSAESYLALFSKIRKEFAAHQEED